MANCTIILGQSGTGKSTSIKNLNPEETVVVNVLGKRLPFKGSQSVYLPGKNLYRYDDSSSIVNLLDSIGKGSKIKNVILDDAIYIMRKEFFNRAKETSFAKFSDIAQHFQSIIAKCETLRDDLNVFFMLHQEEIRNDDLIVGYQPATVGKMLITQYNPIECVPIVLFSVVLYDDKGNPSYKFITHRIKIGTAEVPAKSPAGMFEEDLIDNDLSIVVKAMDEYYK